MKQKRFLSMFALLLMAATGAWAQTETLLTTIKPTGQTTFSETTSGVVTVTHDNNDFSADYGWLWDSQSGSLTVEAKEGYTITRCVFKQNSKTPVTITTSPFKITFGDDGTCEQCDEFMDGVTSIEVYGYAPAPAAPGYSVTLAEGTEDGDKWTISPTEAAEGAEVTATYSGEKKVKSVKAVKKAAPASGTDFATITADYEAKDGETLTGTLASNVKISIADGATVTLKDVTINGVNNPDYGWAGITCAGDATITLEGANMLKGFNQEYPGIYVPEGKTLTIEGEGSLNASGNGRSTGIGGGYYKNCGDIVINGGNITATGGSYNAGIGGGEGGDCGAITITGGTVTATGGGYAAGIGGGNDANCGNITISGGNVTATGGQFAAGIGGGKRGFGTSICGNITISGGTITATGGENAAGIGGGKGRNNSNPSSCGTITITSGVTSVTATKGSSAENSIGAGSFGTCGAVTIEDPSKVTQN